MISMGDKDQFENPSQFIPERWLRGRPEQHQAHSFAYVPFGHGPRMCIGRRFAELELYLLVIKILQRFKMEYHHDPVDFRVAFVNKPNKNVKIQFVDRCGENKI